MENIPITRARHELTTLPERLAEDPGAVAVTRRGKPVLAIMPWDLYDSILETLDVLADEDLMSDLRLSLKEVEAGDTISWDEVKADL